MSVQEESPRPPKRLARLGVLLFTTLTLSAALTIFALCACKRTR